VSAVTDAYAARDALLARTPTPVLLHGLATLVSSEDAHTTDEARVARWTIDELERRYPEVSDTMDAWVDSDTTGTQAAYAAALIDAVRGVEDARKAARTAAIVASVERSRVLASRYPGRVHLIGSGTAVGIPAGDVKTGDTLRYNYGSTAVVTAVRPKGKASVVIETVDEEGRTYARSARTSTLIAISDRPDSNL